MTAIIDIHAREILDSRGNPTIEVDVTLGKLNSLCKLTQPELSDC